MPYYRLYSIDSDGAIDSVREFSARDDQEALRISLCWPRLRPVELWCRSRIVERLEPQPTHRGHA